MIKIFEIPVAKRVDRPHPPEEPICRMVWRDVNVVTHLAKMCEGDFVEIGCNHGATTAEIAKAIPDRKVIGVDWTGGDPTVVPQQLPDVKEACKSEIGIQARHLPNTRFLNVNSRFLNYDDSLFDNVAGILIDADHSYHGVKIDTEKALAFFAGRGGNARRALIWHDVYATGVWDDCPGWIQVEKYLYWERPDLPVISFYPSGVAAHLIGDWQLDSIFETP